MEYTNLHWHLRKLRKPEDINAPPILPSSSFDSSSSIGSCNNNVCSSDTEMEDTTESQSKKGRTKGTTIQKNHDDKFRFFNATNYYIARTFNAMKSECDGKQGRRHKVPKGTLPKIINDARQKFNVPK